MRKPFLIIAIGCLLLSCSSKIKIVGEVVKGSPDSRDFKIEQEKERKDRAFLREIGASQDMMDRERDKTERRKEREESEVTEKFARVAVYDSQLFNEYLKQNADKLDEIIESSTDEYGFNSEAAVSSLQIGVLPVAEATADSNGQFSLTLPSSGKWVFVTKRGISWQTVNGDQKVLVTDGSITSGGLLKSRISANAR